MPKEKDTQPLALSLLHRSHSPDTATKIHTEKIIYRPLHLKPTSPTPSNEQTARLLARQQKRSLAKRKRALKPRPLSSREKKALCIYDIPKEGQRYELYEGLYALWVAYIQDLLGLSLPVVVPVAGVGSRPSTKDASPSSTSVESPPPPKDKVPRATRKPGKSQVNTSDAAKLCSADFHGAELEVVRSRCVSRVGIKGIVVKDGMHCFEIITKGKGKGKDEVKRVPKEGTMFRFAVPLFSAEKKKEDIDGGEDEKGVEDEAVQNEASSRREESNNAAQEEEATKNQKPKELVFQLHGSQFIYRAPDRANRKFKSHFLKDI